MTRRWRWWGGIGGLALGVAVVALVPGWRFEKEKAAARREGLAITIPELKPQPPVSEKDNAAPLVRIARAGWVRTGAYRRGLPILKADAHAIDGTATATERAAVAAWSLRNAPNLAQWRDASRKPRVDYGDRAQYRWSEWGIDLIEDRYAARSLIAAAAVGIDVRANLLAAARLSALMRSEGEIHAASRAASLGIECLQVARRVGLLSEAKSALGPPTDVRAALRPGLPQLLDLIRDIRGQETRDRASVWGWLVRFSPSSQGRELSAVRQWRALWAALPRDPSDYERAARVVDARLPTIMDLTRIDGVPPWHKARYFTVKLGGNGLDTGRSLRTIAAFEALRRSAR